MILGGHKPGQHASSMKAAAENAGAKILRNDYAVDPRADVCKPLAIFAAPDVSCRRLRASISGSHNQGGKSRKFRLKRGPWKGFCRIPRAIPSLRLKPTWQKNKRPACSTQGAV